MFNLNVSACIQILSHRFNLPEVRCSVTYKLKFHTNCYLKHILFLISDKSITIDKFKPHISMLNVQLWGFLPYVYFNTYLCKIFLCSLW